MPVIIGVTPSKTLCRLIVYRIVARNLNILNKSPRGRELRIDSRGMQLRSVANVANFCDYASRRKPKNDNVASICMNHQE